MAKVKAKTLALIEARLMNLLVGNIYSKHNGVCCNLYLTIDDVTSTENFLNDALTEIYGSEHEYPIEGTLMGYIHNKDKWNPNTVYGAKRLMLVQQMLLIVKRRIATGE